MFVKTVWVSYCSYDYVTDWGQSCASKVLPLVAKVRKSCSAPVSGLLSKQSAQPLHKG